MFYIVVKLNFVWVSASMLDETFVNNRAASSPKYWKNNRVFEFDENLYQKRLDLENYIWEDAMKEILWNNYK